MSHGSMMTGTTMAGDPLVLAGNAEASGLYQAVKTDYMPKEGAKLSDAEKKVISDWISKGAKNN